MTCLSTSSISLRTGASCSVVLRSSSSSWELCLRYALFHLSISASMASRSSFTKSMHLESGLVLCTSLWICVRKLSTLILSFAWRLMLLFSLIPESVSFFAFFSRFLFFLCVCFQFTLNFGNEFSSFTVLVLLVLFAPVPCMLFFHVVIIRRLLLALSVHAM